MLKLSLTNYKYKLFQGGNTPLNISICNWSISDALGCSQKLIVRLSKCLIFLTNRDFCQVLITGFKAYSFQELKFQTLYFSLLVLKCPLNLFQFSKIKLPEQLLVIYEVTISSKKCWGGINILILYHLETKESVVENSQI